MRVSVLVFILAAVSVELYCSEKVIVNSVKNGLETILSNEFPNKNKILDTNHKILTDLLALKKIQRQSYLDSYRRCIWKICSPPLRKKIDEVYSQKMAKFMNVMMKLMYMNSMIAGNK